MYMYMYNHVYVYVYDVCVCMYMQICSMYLVLVMYFWKKNNWHHVLTNMLEFIHKAQVMNWRFLMISSVPISQGMSSQVIDTRQGFCQPRDWPRQVQ